MTQLREELRTILAELELESGIRQCRKTDYLYSICLIPPRMQARAENLRQELRLRQWRMKEENGWLLLDHSIPSPAQRDTVLTGERLCLASLLIRHEFREPEDSTQREIQRAWDAGPAACDAWARNMHAEFASRLRTHQMLDDIRPWLPWMEERTWDNQRR
ncbi:MAG: hypothetical protein IJ246_11760 [Clostridia bacterium]|nr:hypothetical protein [Clostridia bacterium]